MTWLFWPQQQGPGKGLGWKLCSQKVIPEWNRCKLKRSGPALMFLSLPQLSLFFSLSLSWKRSGPCGWRDLEQTPGRLCLAVLGRSTLLSLRVYEGPTIKYSTHHWGRIENMPAALKLGVSNSSKNTAVLEYSSTDVWLLARAFFALLALLSLHCLINWKLFLQ